MNRKLTEPDPRRVKEIFTEAAERPPEARPEFLREVCGDDEPLRRRVETLLRSLEEAGDFLAAPTQTSVAGGGGTGGDELPPGTTLGNRYRIVALAGKGGMGVVYRAEDLVLGQTVALKLLPDEVGGDATRWDRLREEARLARRIAHPNVCRVYDVGEADGRRFLSMEWIDGEDLATVLRERGRPAPDRAVSVARQICAGLAAAHDCGILHRDLKPTNVMLDERGVARITDFGVAAFAPEAGGARAREGTPRYMSPEQRSGAPSTFQSDLYSLGLLLYEWFTGTHPAPDGSPAEFREPPPPSRGAPEIDPEIERAILRCLEVDPGRRPASARSIVASFPEADDAGDALAEAQRKADRIAAFRVEMDELRRSGVLRIGEDQVRAVEEHHERTLRDLAARFDVDLTERGKRLSLGLRAISLVGATAMAASLYYFLFRIWGLLTTPLQVAILIAAPVGLLIVTALVARRDRSGYFTSLAALTALSAVVVETSQLEATFNLVPSPVSVLVWAAFALVLGFGFGLRLPVVFGVALGSVFLAGVVHDAAGGAWFQCFARPESFLPAGLLLLAVAIVPRRRGDRPFRPIYDTFAVVLLVAPALFLGMFGGLSYLALGRKPVEIAYQAAAFVLSGGAVGLGLALRRREMVYTGTVFFVAMIFASFAKWCWSLMPRYLFFFLVSLAALGVMLALTRLRRRYAARWTEAAS